MLRRPETSATVNDNPINPLNPLLKKWQQESVKSVVKKVVAVNPLNPLNPLLKKIAAINPVNPSSCLVHFLVGALLALASGKAERRQVHPLEIVSVKSVVKIPKQQESV